MAKNRVPVQSIQMLSRFIKPESLLPVYFFYGEDQYSVDSAIKLLEGVIAPLLSSELDKEVLSGKDTNMVELVDMALSYPFGTGKKLIILRDFDDLKGDKKKLVQYVNNPNPTTIFIAAKRNTISNVEIEPYFTFHKNGYLFEAREPKGEELSAWIIKYAQRRGKLIGVENAALLMDIAGGNRSLIEMQLQKIISYMGNDKGGEITEGLINSISSNLKELTIFDLQNAIALRNARKAYEAAINLLDQGKDILFIISILGRFFTIIARIPELEKSLGSEREITAKLGIYYKYYDTYRSASRYFRDTRLLKAARAVYDADLAVKTSQADPKSVVTILLSEILS